LTADAIDYHGRIEDDEAELLRRAQDGDAEAFGGLVARHRHSALRVATVLLGDGTDADDVVQVATERAWRAITSVDPNRGFRAWFLRIVTNTSRNQRRAWWRRRRAELRVAARPLGTITDPLDDTITASEREVVVAALNRLDATERLVIALRHFEQLNEQEMADVLDCAPGTVKSRLSRAMSKLRAELTMEAFGDG
jgi:RNA polymerase sigma-70 factor, ECF subfamily